MIDIKFLREHPDLVKENIKKKFQEHKLCLVDEIILLDETNRATKLKGDELRANRNRLSANIGALMREGKKDEAEEIKKEVSRINEELVDNEKQEADFASQIQEKMMKIPNMIHESVPIGEDDSKNVEVQKYGEPVVPDYEIPYHTDIMEKLSGIDLDAARRVAGNGFYYLTR